MVVYFEDGPLAHISEIDWPVFKVDAKLGYSNCRIMLRQIDDNYPFDMRVYTNCLDAFSNFWCWDDEKKTPMIYIRDKNNSWRLIQELTNKELRRAHNLEKLYINGIFCNVPN